MQLIIISFISIAAIGLICGLALAFGAKFFHVKEDERIEAVMQLLPGTNCGGCGFAGCAGYAGALVAGTAPANRCPSSSAAVMERISSVLGLAPVAANERKVAIVLCGGDNSKASKRFVYDGLIDCNAAAAIGGGDKSCTYGCLGYGSCVRVCPVNAIELTNGLARVHPDLCISCGKCVTACPREIIHMVPANRHIHVLCASKDKGAVVSKICKAGCIGCRICTKFSDGAITMDGALAVVNYALPLENEIVIEKCPVKCIHKV